MPIVTCPKCEYRMHVRTRELCEYAQCLRCVARFIPAGPAAPRRSSAWGSTAAAMTLVTAGAAALWLVAG